MDGVTVCLRDVPALQKFCCKLFSNLREASITLLLESIEFLEFFFSVDLLLSIIKHPSIGCPSDCHAQSSLFINAPRTDDPECGKHSQLVSSPLSGTHNVMLPPAFCTISVNDVFSFLTGPVSYIELISISIARFITGKKRYYCSR